MNREQWHADRRQCITASNVAPVLGVDSPVGTAFDVWAYVVHGIGAEESPAMRRGRLLQPGIIAFAAEELGLDVEPWPDHQLACGAPDIWGATPDAETVEAWPRIVECKATWQRWSDPPIHVLIQLQVQLYCTGAREGFIAADTAGELRLWGPYEPDKRFHRRGREACRRWWDRHVTGGEMPALDGRASTGRALAEIYKPRPTVIRLPAVASHLRAELATVRATARQAEEYGGVRANQLRALLGPNQYGVTPDGGVVSHVGGQLRLPDKLPRGVRAPSLWRD